MFFRYCWLLSTTALSSKLKKKSHADREAQVIGVIQ